MNNILNDIIQELNRSVKFLIGKNVKVFEKLENDKFNKLKKNITQIEDRAIQDYLEDALRYMINIQEEVVNISFFNQLISKDII